MLPSHCNSSIFLHALTAIRHGHTPRYGCTYACIESGQLNSSSTLHSLLTYTYALYGCIYVARVILRSFLCTRKRTKQRCSCLCMCACDFINDTRQGGSCGKSPHKQYHLVRGQLLFAVGYLPYGPIDVATWLMHELSTSSLSFHMFSIKNKKGDPAGKTSTTPHYQICWFCVFRFHCFVKAFLAFVLVYAYLCDSTCLCSVYH